MANDHDYIALDWVQGEIKQTLVQARKALETYVEDQSDMRQMKLCQTHAHQVYGTLQMVEFYGASLFAEEIQKLCKAIIDGQISSVQEAFEVLMGSFLQLENYLDHIQSGHQDLPVILLPSLNDLRVLQGQSLLSDTTLFTPDFSAVDLETSEDNNLRMKDPKVVANLRKLRQMFQFSLAGIFRSQDLAKNFAYLYKVLARLEKFCKGTSYANIWSVGVGYLDTLGGTSSSLRPATKQLLRDMDYQIKLMIDESETILGKAIPMDLLKNLLYYVAQSTISSKRIDELKEIYSLSQALPSDQERQELQGPGRETLSSVSEALSEELNEIKDALDLYVRGEIKEKYDFSELIKPMMQVANTLAILGLGAGRKVVLEQIERIKHIADSNKPADEQILLDIAGALLHVETNLATFGEAKKTSEVEGSAEVTNTDEEDFKVPVEQFENAHHAVIVESRNGLEQAKNGIVSFITSQWDHSEIEGVPDLLDSIRGGLQIIPLPKAAELLEACSQYICQNLLKEKSVPDWQQLDRLADAITSIEYYLERLSEGASDNDRILQVAEESVAKLGFPTESKSDIDSDTAPAVSLHHVSSVASESPSAVSKETDDDLIDDEILAVFSEEVEEVMADINSAMTSIKSDSGDQHALKELRRAFHTIKGSGRLVGASAVSELAWPVENLLNKYLENSVGLQKETIEFLNAVIEYLPKLMDEFSKQIKSSNYEHFIAQAGELTDQFLKQSKAINSSEEAHETSATPNIDHTSDIAQSETPTPKEDSPEIETAEESAEEDEDDLIDDEILEIFIEEAGEVLETINAHLPVFMEEFDNKDALSELRRAFHTLKGSGRMVGAEIVGESAWAIENLLNRVIDGTVLVNQDIADLVQYATNILPELVGDFENHKKPTVDFSLIETQADALAKGELVQSLGSLDPESEQTVEKGAKESLPGIDSTLLEIFENEAKAHISTVEEFISDIVEGASKPFDDPVSRALHTLKGSANTANIGSITEVAIPVEKFVKEMRAHNLEANYPVAQMLSKAMELIKEAVSQLSEKSKDSLPGAAQFLLTLVDLQTEVLRDLPEDDGLVEVSSNDPQVTNIFLNEGLDILTDADDNLGIWVENPVSGEMLNKLIGLIKTLRRGAAVANLDSIVELSACLEECYATIGDVQTKPTSAFIEDIKLGHDAMADLMNQIAAGLTAASNNKLLAELRGHLALHKKNIEQKDELEKELDVALLSSKPEDKEEPEPQKDSSDPGESDLDPELVEIFLEEAKEIIDKSGDLLHKWRSDTQNLALVGELQRELHTLKGGAYMAEISSIGDLSHELETLFELTVENRFEASPELVSLCIKCHDSLAQMVDCIGDGRAPTAAIDLLAQVKDAMALGKVASEEKSSTVISDSESTSIDTSELNKEVDEGELLSLFLEEGIDILSSVTGLLDQWQKDENGIDGVVELQHEMHTLKGGARLSNISEIGDIADAVNKRLEHLFVGDVSDPHALLTTVRKACQEMASILEGLKHGRSVSSQAELIEEINSVAASVDEVEIETEVDSEVIEMFVEEAGDLIGALEEQISAWSKEPDNSDYNKEIQRILHTLKGGARLSNLQALADASHKLESKLIESNSRKQSFAGQLKKSVLAEQDVLLKLVDDIQSLSGISKPKTEDLVDEPKAELADEVVTTDLEGEIPEAKEQADLPDEPEPIADEPKTHVAPPVLRTASPKANQKAASQETIRVSAGLLEELVNLAGETSISRGRLEQQISDFGFTLEEMTATIDRLREQLRRMDMETEAQVLFSAEKEGLGGPDYSDFDPLEMDRYSSIQQLSRALTESTSDLSELRESLSDRARDAETLLLQQSRINSELQEGLMKTRMIPFSSMVPRLRRIVRQIGGELGKEVDFDVLNAEGEMDRSVLERMIAPLEHMLRNALDHGIESEKERKKANKPVVGAITLSLSREGGDVVLKMKDDGAGINQDQVLDKAISQGLAIKNADLNTYEILQFILLPGFSTAEEVTQISGRGVGMDVVANEIKQMGGSISIDSTLGKGTEFTVRLPFTVSVNRALMVNIGDDFYAVPLNTIEGIVRVSSYELEEYYTPDAPLYEYAGQKYKLQYLGGLMQSGHRPKLQGQVLPLPVILVRGTEEPMALQVDNLMGSREIVVKSLGLQFAGVHGVSGATILGDGSVVVILDLPALIRDESIGTLDIDDASTIQGSAGHVKTVMVVDDSVTVRKVTTRLLERNGMDVITAKDGVDAIALLQDHKPDLMLLDIEMPRMDGFEVATLVKHDAHLKDVPIIMITSRTGQKHKERADAIGVDEYLGKPFQEKELLENIERLTGKMAKQ